MPVEAKIGLASCRNGQGASSRPRSAGGGAGWRSAREAPAEQQAAVRSTPPVGQVLDELVNARLKLDRSYYADLETEVPTKLRTGHCQRQWPSPAAACGG
jgi:hypothetical protein